MTSAVANKLGRIFGWYFFSIWVLFQSTIHRTAGEGVSYLFHSSLPPPPVHRHLDITRAVTADSSTLHNLAADADRELLVSKRKLVTTKLHLLPASYVAF